MKILLSLFALLLSSVGYSQIDSTQVFDTLSKYSYPIIEVSSHDNQVKGTATGFFIRHKGKLFLVSAYHAGKARIY